MGAFWALFICVLTVWLTKGSCLPVSGSTESGSNGLQRRMRDLPADDLSIKKALTLHHSHEAMSVRKYKKVTVEANEVNVEASALYLKVLVDSNNKNLSLLADSLSGNAEGNRSLLADSFSAEGNLSLLADSFSAEGNLSLLADSFSAEGNLSLLADSFSAEGNLSLLADSLSGNLSLLADSLSGNLSLLADSFSAEGNLSLLADSFS